MPDVKHSRNYIYIENMACVFEILLWSFLSNLSMFNGLVFYLLHISLVFMA